MYVRVCGVLVLSVTTVFSHLSSVLPLTSYHVMRVRMCVVFVLCDTTVFSHLSSLSLTSYPLTRVCVCGITSHCYHCV